MSRIAFLDLDRTLLLVNSGKLWFRRERAEGRLRTRHAVEAAMWVGLYGLGLMKGTTALERAVRLIRGDLESELAARTRSFFEQDLAPHFAPGGLVALDAHRRAGDRTVLLTSSSQYVANCVQERLALDEVISMRLGVKDGRFTGEIEQFCYGPHKVGLAEAAAARAGTTLQESVFYTDSMSDLPMLERVGRPVVVQPDPRLLRIARKRGWQVLDWRGEAGSEDGAGTGRGEGAAVHG